MLPSQVVMARAIGLALPALTKRLLDYCQLVILNILHADGNVGGASSHADCIKLALVWRFEVVSCPKPA